MVPNKVPAPVCGPVDAAGAALELVLAEGVVVGQILAPKVKLIPPGVVIVGVTGLGVKVPPVRARP